MMVMLSIDLPHIENYRILELIHESDRSLVYRACNGHDGQSVVIKLMRNEYPSLQELVQFRNQYAIAKNLEIEGIVRPYALERYKNRYALIMEDVGGIALKNWQLEIGNRDNISAFFDIAIQLAEILQQLHQKRVIHKDIKPANILIHPHTQHIKLIDFSISSLLPKETQTLKTPNVLEGTLAYLSPEQTGRMNRGIDYRSDFYSLGATFYELLTGKLPFETNDPLELIHCHIAKTPPSISDSRFPTPLVDIVMKLMAKNAEDRYQSAIGLKYDLEKCRTQWQASKTIAPFVLGERDWCDRFLIPEKLYGREQEVQTLLDAFERISQGNTELMLVAGYSGIGKTAVINEVHKPITRQHGYFLKGKFDQFNRNIPFSAFVQAFRSLMGQLLGEADDVLVRWKNTLIEALGESGQVLIEVIPELERIIGKQPPVPELSGSAAQHRFNLLFGKFIRAIATPEHPLVIFLDDLQWVDSASLNLFKLLMAGESGYLLVLGAYRDNEVFPAHPLILTLEEIRQQQAAINTLTLEPLREEDIDRLVGDSLHCSVESAKPLSQLVYQKTKGNPFFATQFLQGLYEDGWIVFIPPQFPFSQGRGSEGENLGKRRDREGGYWQCDLTRVRQLAVTDDVVAFMVKRLRKLPEETQDALKIAACMGNQFDLGTLATVCEQNQEEVASSLWRSLQMGLVIPENETYKFFQGEEREIETADEIIVNYRFLHDRVQQAAYSLIEENVKQANHLKIGRLLLDKIIDPSQDDRLFNIVNNFNLGIDLVSNVRERKKLAELNFQAGRKAKYSTAYCEAVSYFNIGIHLLTDKGWNAHYDLMLDLYSELAESQYLSGDFEAIDTTIALVSPKIKSLLDATSIHATQILSYHGKGNLLEGLSCGLQFLKALGVEIPEGVTEKDTQQALAKTLAEFDRKSTEELIRQPTAKESKLLAIQKILWLITSCAYKANPQLMPFIICEQVNVTMSRGNSSFAASIYALYGMLLCGLQDFESGYRAGEVALGIRNRNLQKEFEARTLNLVFSYIMPWKRLLKESIPYLKEALVAGAETGDIEYTSYAAIHYCQFLYLSGANLEIVEREMQVYCELLRQIKQEAVLQHTLVFHQTILNLRGCSEKPTQLNGTVFNETERVAALKTINNRYCLGGLYINKLALSYLFGMPHQGIEYAAIATEYSDGLLGEVCLSHLYFYRALSYLAIQNELSAGNDRNGNNRVAIEKVRADLEKLKEMAAYAPMNFGHQVCLIEAEQARCKGQKLAAIALYDRAIAGAKANEYIQDEALANERAAQFYFDWGKEKVAAGYMQEAYYGYARWGAKAKIADLETRYPQLLKPILQPPAEAGEVLNALTTIAALNISSHSSSSSSKIEQAFDFASILKASQVLAEIVERDELLRRFTQIALQNSGGDRCALILPNRKGEWQIEAIATAENFELCRIPLDRCANLPVKLIQYVKNTCEVLAIDKDEMDLPVSDPYLFQQQPQSLLCLPVLHQGQLAGIAYASNQSTPGVFTRDRLLVLNFLCTQAAISLENARLYALERERSEQLSALNHQLSVTQYSMDRTADGILWFDSSFRFSYANQAACNLLEYSREELLQRSISDIETRYSIEQIQKLWQRLQQEGSLIFESVLRAKSGRIYPVELHSKFLEYNGQAFSLTRFRDISDRKELEREQARLIAVLEATPDYVGIATAQGEILWHNKQLRELRGDLGYPDDHRSISHCHPDWVNRIILNEALPAAIERGSWSGESALLDGEGREIPVSQVIIAHKSETGKVEHFSTIMRDIRDRKAAEERLRTSEQRYATLAAAAPVGIFRTDAVGYCLYVNERWCQIAGLTPEAAFGEGWQQGLHPDDRDRIAVEWDRSARENRPFGLEYRFQCPDGTVTWVYGQSVPERDGEDNIIGHVGTIVDITDRKQAEIELKSVTDRLTLALQSGDLGYWQWTIATNKVYWDDRLYELHGIPQGTLNYETFRATVHPEDIVLLEDLVQQAIAGKNHKNAIGCSYPYELIYRIPRSDDKTIFVKTYGRVLRDRKGNATGMLGVTFNITPLKQAEEQLQQQAREDRLIAVLLQRMRASLSLAEILATTLEELRQILHCDRVLACKSEADGLGIAIAESVGEEWISLLEEKYCEGTLCFSSLQHRFQNGDTSAYISNNTKEEEHKENRQAFQDFCDRTSMRAKLAVPIARNQDLWGLLIVHQCDGPRHWQPWEIDLLGRIADQLAIAIQQADLFERLQQELQERQAAQAQLAESNQQLTLSNRELARATRLKDEFLATMSHELRTPLNSILGLTEGLQEGIFGVINPKQHNALNTIKGSSDRLLALINDILDLSKISAEKMELSLTPTDIPRLCYSCLPLIRQQARKKNIQIQTAIPADLPLLAIDEQRMSQVLVNLLSNAVKFTPEGGRVSLTVHSQPLPDPTGSFPHGFLRITVRDTGIGIAPENMDKLFQPFVQIDSALNRQYEGTGLGLALVKQLVELHGGRAIATSEPGVGSSFMVDLPQDATRSLLSLPEMPTLIKEEETRPQLDTAPSVLLVEDDRANITTLSSYLEIKGYCLTLAENGQEAVELARSLRPDLILMDIQMPVMDGLEAIEQIRQEMKEIPIFALTALAMKGDRERCLAVGADEYLSKPLKLKILDTLIQQYLSKMRES